MPDQCWRIGMNHPWLVTTKSRTAIATIQMIPSASHQPRLGRRHCFLFRWPTLWYPTKLPACLLLPSVFWLLRASGNRVHPHLRLFVLRYLSDPELRYRVQLQLNRGEARHELVGRCLFFANRGEFRSGDAEEIMNKASSLRLLSNAVLVWNTLRITEIVNQLSGGGPHDRR
jgi:hypothetical protein